LTGKFFVSIGVVRWVRDTDGVASTTEDVLVASREGSCKDDFLVFDDEGIVFFKSRVFSELFFDVWWSCLQCFRRPGLSGPIVDAGEGTTVEGDLADTQMERTVCPLVM